MTKSNHLQASQTTDDDSQIKGQDDSYGTPDISYTQFSFIEEIPADFDSIPKRQTYPDDLPDDNIEATFLLMKDKESK